jgi:hypothetical protein
MRLRRWKVHRLGFKDFSGIEYINKKLPKPEDFEPGKYEFIPPVRKSSPMTARPFDHSVEVRYADN